MSAIQPLPEELHDFRRFLYLVWDFLALPSPTPVQYDIARWLQHGPRRKVIEAFRGVGKSWITSAYVVWRLRINPQLNFLVVSASKDRSDSFSTFTKRLIWEMPLLQCLIPSDDQRSSNIAFDVRPAEPDHAPSVKSVGIYGQMTGTRADEIIADDVEIPKNVLTQVQRERLAEAVKEFDAILKPGGTITYLGTPQTELSLYNTLRSRGYVVRLWPARYPDNTIYKCDEALMAPSLVQKLANSPSLKTQPTDPLRFNNEDLVERELSYGRSGFALQYMLDTSLSDAERYPLKIKDIIIHSVDSERAPEKLVWADDTRYTLNDLPNVGLSGDKWLQSAWKSEEWAEYTGRVMSIDPSGRGADETGYAVSFMLNGFLHIPEACGLRGGYEDHTLEELAKIAKRNKVNKIIIESNFGDGMYAKLLTPFLQRIYPCTVEEVRVTGQKERRIIDILEPVLNQHRLVIDRKVVEKDWASVKDLPTESAHQYMLFYQLARLTREKNSLAHDDRLDALSMAVWYWVDQMAQDADIKMQHHREDRLEEELKAFTSHISKMGGFSGLSCITGDTPQGEALRLFKRP